MSETRWDFLVEHLLGVQPPEGYRITAFDPAPEMGVERR
jgi:hypothetical protein